MEGTWRCYPHSAQCMEDVWQMAGMSIVSCRLTNLHMGLHVVRAGTPMESAASAGRSGQAEQFQLSMCHVHVDSLLLSYSGFAHVYFVARIFFGDADPWCFMGTALPAFSRISMDVHGSPC